MLRPSQLQVDPEVQRVLIVAHARKIASEYDPALFGVGHASLRKCGRYFVVDGQHRIRGAVDAVDDTPVLFEVHYGLSKQGEADLFTRLNETRKAVSALDLFRMRVAASEPHAVAITQMLAELGLMIAATRARGAVYCVGAVEAVYFGRPNKARSSRLNAEPTPNLLRAVLEVLKAAWGDDSTAYNETILKGLAMFLLKRGGDVNRDALARQLIRSGTPQQFFGQIKACQQFSKRDALTAAVEIIEGTYRQSRARGAKA